MNVVWAVDIIESERGWGSRCDETVEFETEKEARTFVTEYNKVNDKKVVPDWYMYAAEPREVIKR